MPEMRVFLLRFWIEKPGTGEWRFVLEEVMGERHRRGFRYFDELVAYLREEMKRVSMSSAGGSVAVEEGGGGAGYGIGVVENAEDAQNEEKMEV